MIDPLGYGLEADVTFIAGAACFAAKNTLEMVSSEPVTSNPQVVVGV